MDDQQYCEHCGAAIDADSQFCKNCGKPVPVPAQPTPEDYPEPGEELIPPVDENKPKAKRSSRTWPLLAGGGCLLAACACLFVAGGLFLLQSPNLAFLPFAPTQAAEMQVLATEQIMVLSTDLPADTPEPAPTDLPQPAEPLPTDVPEQPGPDLTGNQRLDENYLFDDFSSTALGWPVYDDGTTIIKYEDDAYSFQITEPDYYDWAYAPVDFYANMIEFDVWGMPGKQNGTFGVMCQLQDEDNHYYVEFDLDYGQFLVGKVYSGENSYLTGTGDDNWLSADSMKTSPDEVNRISVECSQDTIMLTINDVLQYTAQVNEPLLPDGEMALFVFANSDAADSGYKVFFDNALVERITE